MELRSFYVDVKPIPVPELTMALTYWEEKRGDRIAPSWSEISLIDFDLALIPYMNVIDIAENRSDTRYRFWGTGLTTIYGEDYTNRSPESFPSAKLGRNAASGYEKLVEEKVPNCEVREFRQSSGLIGRQIILRLPLSDDGTHINRAIVLHSHEIKDPNQNIKRFFEEVFDRNDQQYG